VKKLPVSYLSEISFRRGVWLFLVIIAVLIGGTWATVKITADRLLNHDAEDNARDWAYLLAANVTDLEQIAAGEQPSKQSVAYFEAARKAGHVFRYVIYNREGYSQLVADRSGLSFVDISSLSPKRPRRSRPVAPSSIRNRRSRKTPRNILPRRSCRFTPAPGRSQSSPPMSIRPRSVRASIG
jgi:hypothetical protein